MNKTSFYFIGADPGVYGAIAVIRRDRKIVLVEDTPAVKVAKAPSVKQWRSKKTGKTIKVVSRSRTELDFGGLRAVFCKIVDLPGLKHGMIERVSARHTDSGVSAFTFGGAYWALQQAFHDFDLDYGLVEPRAWQRYALGDIPKDKKERRDAYLARARQLFPNAKLSLKKHAEQAAALLIADFCRESHVSDDHIIDPGDLDAPDL